jgi:L-lactate dehydrogenase (cytochrome)/(S)-mandelate dehydrogenase
MIKALDGMRFSLGKRRPPINVDEYRAAAQRTLPEMVWTFMENGAEDEDVVQRNRSDFGRWQLRQRVLTGATGKDLAVRVGGITLSLPLVLSPTGLNGLFNWEGEVGAARAAEAAGIRHISSTGASYSLEEVARATRAAHWFQLYPWGDRSFMDELVGRAERAGFGALFITVDVPVVGNREGEKRVGMTLPLPTLTPQRLFNGALRPRWTYGYLKHQRITLRNFVNDGGASAAARSVMAQAGFMRPELLSWENLEWLRERWSGPAFVKGITEPEDARRVMDLGYDGIAVSNHGGRQLDKMTSAVGALPEIVDAVEGRGQILLDGGVRRGSDVVKALCLGATACMIGRPFLYGLAVGGRHGVADVIEIFRSEIERTLVLMGCESVSRLDRSWLREDDSRVPLRSPDLHTWLS